MHTVTSSIPMFTYGPSSSSRGVKAFLDTFGPLLALFSAGCGTVDPAVVSFPALGV